jgi:hypothetical protein
MRDVRKYEVFQLADQPRAANRLRLTAIGAEILLRQSCTEPLAVSRKPMADVLGWDMDNTCEPDNSEFRTQRPECRTSGHSDFWFLTSDFCIIRFVNRKGLSETFKQVIHEESIKVGLTAVGVEAILIL